MNIKIYLSYDTRLCNIGGYYNDTDLSIKKNALTRMDCKGL